MKAFLQVVDQGGDVCEQAISLLQPCQVWYQTNSSNALSKWVFRPQKLRADQLSKLLFLFLISIFLLMMPIPSDPQCRPVGRMVHGLPRAELQHSVPEVGKLYHHIKKWQQQAMMQWAWYFSHKITLLCAGGFSNKNNENVDSSSGSRK